ncbi:P-loop containing nucleoside triphosphate hydrolase protein [Pavlovales sp. CCMP2436]|nr:P-loop containing nucleoside triphosphate hydrolase protein [Pavlovales sp. CCMP2436]
MASDLSDLQAVDEGSISDNCRERYNRDEIYTSCGRLLIALNPYKRLPIYGVDAIGQYHGAMDRTALPPHIYAVAAAAYHGMGF